MSRKVAGCRLKWLKILFVVLIIGVLIGILFYAPHYLAYSDTPQRSDAVVLLVGPDFEARKKEAHRLIEDEYADFLIIPAYGGVSKAARDKTADGWMNPFGMDEWMIRMNGQRTGRDGSQSSDDRGLTPGRDGKLKPLKEKRVSRKPLGKHANLYEDTHLEILYAKGMMDEHGFKSAIFVSSPYHMRRIKIMAGRVFAQKVYDCSFVPTRYEKSCDNLWWTNGYCLKWVMGEYIKIVWFLLYEPFISHGHTRTDTDIN